MQVTITIDRTFFRRSVAVGTACAALAVLGRAQASQVASLNTFVGGSTISAAAVNANFEDLRVGLNDTDTRVAALEALLAGVTRSGTTLQFAGVDVQIVNGAGTTGSANGTGNLILGYNDDASGPDRSGSHNLVVGDDHGYSGTGGLVLGTGNAVDGEGGVCLGGTGNAAHTGVVVGGQNNTAASGHRVSGTPDGAVVVGGDGNTVVAPLAVIVGGSNGTIDADPGEPASTGYDGVGHTMLGSAGATPTIDGEVSVADNVTGLAIGWGAGYVEIATGFTAYCGIGQIGPMATPPQFGLFIGSNTLNNLGINGANINLGGGATQVNVGNNAGGVQIAFGANACDIAQNTVNASFGHFNSGGVFVGFGATNGVDVGNGASAVNIGFEAPNVSVGNTNTVGKNVNLVMGCQGGPGPSAGNVNVQLANAYNGQGGSSQVIVGQNLAAANFGNGGGNVVVGDNTSNTSLGNGSQTVNVGNNVNGGMNIGGGASGNIGIGGGAPGNIFIGVGGTGTVTVDP